MKSDADILLYRSWGRKRIKNLLHEPTLVPCWNIQLAVRLGGALLMLHCQGLSPRYLGHKISALQHKLFRYLIKKTRKIYRK